MQEEYWELAGAHSPQRQAPRACPGLHTSPQPQGAQLRACTPAAWQTGPRNAHVPGVTQLGGSKVEASASYKLQQISHFSEEMELSQARPQVAQRCVRTKLMGIASAVTTNAGGHRCSGWDARGLSWGWTGRGPAAAAPPTASKPHPPTPGLRSLINVHPHQSLQLKTVWVKNVNIGMNIYFYGCCLLIKRKFNPWIDMKPQILLHQGTA